MKRILLVFAAVAVATSCSRPQEPQQAGAAGAAVDAAKAARASEVDTAGMDTAIKPGDDFFAYANGAWLRSTEIPADQVAWGSGAIIDRLTNEQLRTLLEDAGKDSSAPAPVAKAGRYYAAFMNEAAIEQKGLAALQPRLAAIDAIADRAALATALGRTLRNDVDPLNATNYYTEHLFGLFVAQDFNDPSHNTAYLLQGGLGMPDREYYLSSTPSIADIRGKYPDHVAKVLELAQLPHGKDNVGRILALENAIARVHATRQDSADVNKANNRWARADFATNAPGLDWNAFFAAANLSNQSAFIVWQPAAIKGEAALVAATPLEDWKTYLRYHQVNEYLGVMPKAFADERFAFYQQTLSGQREMLPRWRRGVLATGGALGDAVGQAYVARHFPPAAKAKVAAMVDDIKKAFAVRIDRLDWMTPETKAKARAKVESLIVGVGYPDNWRDDSGLEVAADDALGNALRADEFVYQQELVKLRGPVDRHEWWMTPQTVNAVNLPIQNALNFPAAFLQEPVFSLDADAARNYGAVGAVIGHEISHSFDDTGSQFDATGRMANWWQPADFARFKEAGARLIGQYNAYKPLPDMSVNGALTLGENIADVAGLAAAYDAYRAAEPNAPVIQGFTGDQRFFISFAQAWRDKWREPLLRQVLLTDGHAPSEYRADTVRNLDAWYAAFNVQPGDKLYLAPGDRVRVW